MIFIVTAKCWREGCFAPPPFTPRSDRCNFITTYNNYINDAQ